MNINLIGMRGVGKSNVARRLSVLSKRAVMSTDLLIEYENATTIPELIAASDGDWRAFREREYEVVRKVAQLDGLIVDCGGGVIVDLADDGAEVFSERKVDLLRGSGPIVWLQGDIGRLAAKAVGDSSRPSLHAQHSAEQIMRSRLPFYEAAADFTIFVERGERQQVASAIAEQYGILLG
jgi:shikimate kinase